MKKCIRKKCGYMMPDDAAFCPACGMKQPVETVAVPHKRANGSGSVFFDNSRGSWVARRRFSSAGTSLSKTGFESREEAESWLEKTSEAGHEVPCFTTLDLWSLFEQSNSFIRLTPNTQSKYRTAYNRIKELWARPIYSLTYDECQGLINRYGSRSCASKYIKHVLHVIFREAVIRGALDGSQDFTGKLTLPAQMPSKERICFSPEDISTLFSSLQNKALEPVLADVGRAVLLMIFTGMRPIEVRDKHLRIYFDEGYLVGGSKTEAGRGREIVLPDVIRPIVEQMLKRKKYGLMAMSEDSLYKYWPVLRDMLGLDKRLEPYCARHTWATALHDAEVDERLIKSMLGHKQPDVTGLYTHLRRGKKMEAANKAAALLSDTS